MKTVIPAALTIIVGHGILYALVRLGIFDLSQAQFNSIAIIITNIVFLFVLFEQCRPWTWWKIVIYVVFLGITIAAYILSMANAFNGAVFEYVQAVNLNTGNHEYLLLLFCFALASYYILQAFKKMLATKPKKVRNPYRKQI